VTLRGKHVLVTAGPTHEPIDPVRVIANRSSGRQGFAIAAAAADAGARVTLVAGPVSLDTPVGVCRIDVETDWSPGDPLMHATIDKQHVVIQIDTLAYVLHQLGLESRRFDREWRRGAAKRMDQQHALRLRRRCTCGEY